MSSAPTVPATPSRILDHAQVGELSTALVVDAGPADTARFIVSHGRPAAPASAWSSHRYPFTADGERDARAKFAALVDAAATVQVSA